MEEGGEEVTSTFQQNLAVYVRKVVNTLAVDSTGKFAVLGGKKGLYIVDLDFPNESTRTLSQQSKWEVSVVEWNPHEARKTIIASTSNQNTLIWDVGDQRMALQSTLQTHQRAVSDLSWSLFDPNILATCSADTYINLWDVRDSKKAIKRESFCGWTAGATQVKWNRHNPMTLASAHNGEVRIWDIRKVATPVTFITAHMAKIYGVDWSHIEENDLLTCSEDKQVKFWNVSQPRICKATLQSGVPLLRARYTPFGDGIVTMAARGDHALRVWSTSDFTTPVKQFIGHTDVLTSFDWRVRQVNNEPEYQLVTWSKDQHLRLWHIDAALVGALSAKKSSAPMSAASKPEMESEPVSLPDKFSYGINDLAQEFSMLEKRKMKDIIIEEMSTTKRACVVAAGRASWLKMRITFPSLYPHGAAPSFQLLPGTSTPLPAQAQAKLIESLIRTAAYHVENNRPCLYQCLCQLVLLLKEDAGEEEELLFSSSPPDSGFTTVGGPLRKAPLKQDSHIPSPRTSGAYFGGCGKLIYFNSWKYPKVSSRGSSGPPRFRTYSDLRSHLTDTQSQPRSEGSSVSISTYFYSPQNYKQEMTIRTSPMTLRMDNGMLGIPERQSSAVLMNSVLVKDCSYLMPLHYDLGLKCQTSGSLEEICSQNSALAEAVDRKDLVDLWSIVKLVLDPSVYSSPVWVQAHPMGKQMLQSLFQHYEKLRDVQTLAILSCVFAIPSQVPKPASSISATLKLGSGSVVTVANKKARSSTAFLLNEELANKYDQFKIAYGDILFRWQLLDKRAEIRKYLNQTSSKQDTIVEQCPMCSDKDLRSYHCNRCKKFLGHQCAICHLTVRGISNYCLNCGHGGHTQHMKEWFATHQECPTGCGCKCIQKCAEVYTDT